MSAPKHNYTFFLIKHLKYSLTELIGACTYSAVYIYI